MLFERIEQKGLAAYFYVIGDQGEAVVIDPRRDCQVYLELAADQGMHITHILETHRHEDFVLGSKELAARSGAVVWHADRQWTHAYGQPAESESWQVGRLSIQALSTPGHTPGSLSYLLSDAEANPWAVFSGDTLFSGEVGRVDFLGMEEAPRWADALYHSLFGVLLPLGDGILLCPAHGAGSLCGGAITERAWTTIGLERKSNPALQTKSREEFQLRFVHRLEFPPYFTRMERWNLDGSPSFCCLPLLPSLPPARFARMQEEALVLDLRSPLAYCAAHIHGSLSIWEDSLASYAGWFLPEDRPILLVSEGIPSQEALLTLLRMGFDRLSGYLQGGLLTWQMAGFPTTGLSGISAADLCAVLDGSAAANIVDVRNQEERERDGVILESLHIPLVELPGRFPEIPRGGQLCLLCSSGVRSVIAASLLERAGWHECSASANLVVVQGGMTAWNAQICPPPP